VSITRNSNCFLCLAGLIPVHQQFGHGNLMKIYRRLGCGPNDPFRESLILPYAFDAELLHPVDEDVLGMRRKAAAFV
jgi:hypothetical protein